MTGAVNLNARDQRAIAEEAWGAELPAWVALLAEEAFRTTSSAVARRIGYTDSVVSGVLRRKYAGDLRKVETAVRGALMGETVDCPELLEITRDQCLWEQKQPWSSASALRAAIYRACRAGCPHSRIKGADDALDQLA